MQERDSVTKMEHRIARPAEEHQRNWLAYGLPGRGIHLQGPTIPLVGFVRGLLVSGFSEDRNYEAKRFNLPTHPA